MITKQEIKELLDVNGRLSTSKIKKKNVNINPEELYLIFNNISKPVCLNDNCSNPVKFRDFTKGYRKYCCVKCYQKDYRKQENIKTAMLEKYGTDNIFSSEYGKEKIKETIQEKYKVDNYFQSSEFLEIDRHDTRDDFIEKSIQCHGILYNYTKVIYNSSQEKVNIICHEHGIWSTRPYNHIQGSGCPKCNTSKAEIEVLESISNDHKIIHNDRKILQGKELDIYIPEKFTAIEYNGLMFHSQGKETGKIKNTGKNYHLNKTIECEKQGIQLFHIFENEWLSKREIWESVLNNKINPENSRRIFARKCDIKPIRASDARLFEDNNHLQGQGLSSIRYGLFYDDEMVSLMTFGKARMSKKYQYELIRFCSLKNTIVIGAGGKLLKYFERENKPESLVTYANRRWSQGDLYFKLGFEYSHISPPNYFYFKNNSVLYSRNMFQKHKLKDKLEEFNPGLTEWENMKMNNYRKIYDSGNLVFHKNYK